MASFTLLRVTLLLSLLLCLLQTSAHHVISNPPAADQQQGGQKLWCVANPSVPDAALTANLNFACGEGGADCRQLEPGGACYNPNTLISHASYAMNLYYQVHGRNYWNCYFHNTGLVVFTDPSYGSCTYPPQ